MVASNANADKIDISDLLVDYSGNGSIASLAAFVQLSQSGTNTVLRLDRDGASGDFGFATLLTLNNVQVDLATLISNQQLVI